MVDIDILPVTDKPIHDNVSFDNLYPAIVQCFAIILLGYVAGRAGLVSKVQGEGIAYFVSRFCLPSLLFISMCELNFASVNWMFLLGILISKAIVFVMVAVVTLVAKRPHNIGYAGIFAIFATQSNDFALGYPIIQALYKDTNPEFCKYIYLIAPISLVVLNPIGFIMLEIHKYRSANLGDDSTTLLKLVWDVVKGMITNPIIFMTVIGIVGNFAFDRNVPNVLKDMLNVLGNAYSAGALFYLGLSMVGKIRSQLGLSLIIPLILIATKGIILPLVCWQLIESLVPAQNGTSPYSMFGFLYGTIPTAPSLMLYASQFDVAHNIIATGLVLGTFLSAPLMFVSAKMMTVMVDVYTDYLQLLHDTAFDVSIISLISGVWVLGIFVISGKWQRIPHRYTMGLTFSQICSCLGMVLYKACGEGDSMKGWHVYPILILLLVGIFSVRCWTAILSVVLCLLRVRSLCYVMRIQMWLYFFGFGLPILLTGLIFLIGSHNIDNEIGPSFHYGNLQTIVSMVLLLICLIISFTSIVYWQRAERHMSGTVASYQYKRLQNVDGPNDCDQGSENTPVVNSPTRRNMNLQRSNAKRATSIEDLVATEANYQEIDQASGEDNPLMENISERTCLLGRCSAEQRNTCRDTLRTYAATITLNDSSPHEEELRTQLQQQQEEYQTGHHLILLLLLLLSVFFGFFLCTWKLLHNSHTSGIFVEVEFLDIVLNYGQGILIIAVFGFDTRLVFSPVMRRLRRFWFGAEVLHLPKITDLDTNTMQSCQQFVDYHKDNCAKEIVKDRRFRFKTYKEVFTGKSMCDWLLRAGLVSSRENGVEYGQRLLNGRIITHINSEFNFHDSPHFYKFVDNYEELTC